MERFWAGQAEDFYPALPDRPQGLLDGAGLVGEVRGLTPAASDALMKRLLWHCTRPQFTAAHTWQDHDLVIWYTFPHCKLT